MSEFDPLCLLQLYNQLWWTNLVTCPFENYSLSIRCSPIKVTHPEARFCDSVGDSLMVTHTDTHHPSIHRYTVLLSLMTMSLYNLNGHPFSWSPDIINNLISNQCGYTSMLKTGYTSPINSCYLFSWRKAL